MPLADWYLDAEASDHYTTPVPRETVTPAVRHSTGGVLGRVPIGLRQMAYGAFFFSIMSVCVKLASRHLPSSHTVLARGAVTLVMSLIALRGSGLSFWGIDKKRLILRGFAGFVALNCYYYSLKHLPLADATVIQYSSPIFTAILAALVLRERMGPREIVCVIGSFIGVLLVAQPPFLFAGRAQQDKTALLIAVAGSVVSAIAYVTIRKLRGTENPSVIVLYFPLVAVPLSIPPIFRDATMPTPFEWGLLLAIGVTTQIAQVFMTKSLCSEPAGRATAVSYLQVAFAYVWGLLVFGEVPNSTSLVGATIVAASILSLAVLKDGATVATATATPNTTPTAITNATPTATTNATPTAITTATATATAIPTSAGSITPSSPAH